MVPCSNSSVASFSFHAPAYQSIISNSSGDGLDGAGPGQPPSDLVLCATTNKIPVARLSNRECISTLPTMLIYLIKSWLVDKDTLQLILTCHRMSHEVQGFYRLRLRAAAAELSASAIGSCQNTVNLRPALVYMHEDGEQMFQKCLSLKSPSLSQAEYRAGVIQLLKARLPLTNDLNELRELVTAAGLGLGGTVMSAENRDGLLSLILESYQTTPHRKMGAMIQGICAAIGPRLTKSEHHLAVCDQILASCKTSSPSQMGSMVRGLCIFFGGINMPQGVRRFVISKILASHKTLAGLQMRGMIYTVCLALGGRNMSLQHRDGLMEQILALYALHRELPLESILQGLFKGYGDTEMRFDGRDMKPADMDAVLTRILGCHDIWDNREMGIAIAALCFCLGDTSMPAINRDRVLSKILSSSASCSPDQVGAMMLSVCHALGGRAPGGINRITQDNLAAMLSQILGSHALVSQEQMGAMLHYLFRALGQVHISAQHRDLLVAHIKKSARVPEIVAAITLTDYGQTVVETLGLGA